MKFCTECGEKLDTGAKFCGSCGFKIPAKNDSTFSKASAQENVFSSWVESDDPAGWAKLFEKITPALISADESAVAAIKKYRLGKMSETVAGLGELSDGHLWTYRSDFDGPTFDLTYIFPGLVLETELVTLLIPIREIDSDGGYSGFWKSEESWLDEAEEFEVWYESVNLQCPRCAHLNGQDTDLTFNASDAESDCPACEGEGEIEISFAKSLWER